MHRSGCEAAPVPHPSPAEWLRGWPSTATPFSAGPQETRSRRGLRTRLDLSPGGWTQQQQAVRRYPAASRPFLCAATTAEREAATAAALAARCSSGVSGSTGAAFWVLRAQLPRLLRAQLPRLLRLRLPLGGPIGGRYPRVANCCCNSSISVSRDSATGLRPAVLAQGHSVKLSLHKHEAAGEPLNPARVPLLDCFFQSGFLDARALACSPSDVTWRRSLVVSRPISVLCEIRPATAAVER